jgi:flagella basal body P-ring formation protein FlgA
MSHVARLILVLISLVTATRLDAQQPTVSPGVTLLAAREIPRGATIEAADIAAEGAEATTVVGWVAKRLIRAGEALRAPAIAPAELVRSGDTVQLVWRDGNLEIRMTGRAMGSAAAGERVIVRVDTQRRFEGIAEAPGVVRLNKLEKSR